VLYWAAIFDGHRPSGMASEDSHRLACLTIREFILQQPILVQIVNNGLLNYLTVLLQQSSFWLLSSERYVQGDNFADNFRHYHETLSHCMGQIPLNQGINQELILLNRATTTTYPTQQPTADYVAFFSP
jgi:hypothetical protein